MGGSFLYNYMNYKKHLEEMTKHVNTSDVQQWLDDMSRKTVIPNQPNHTPKNPFTIICNSIIEGIEVTLNFITK